MTDHRGGTRDRDDRDDRDARPRSPWNLPWRRNASRGSTNSSSKEGRRYQDTDVRGGVFGIAAVIVATGVVSAVAALIALVVAVIY